MKSFLQKLETAAARLVSNMDNQLQEPVVRTMTGEVFTNGTPNIAARKSHEVFEASSEEICETHIKPKRKISFQSKAAYALNLRKIAMNKR